MAERRDPILLSLMFWSDVPVMGTVVYGLVFGDSSSQPRKRGLTRGQEKYLGAHIQKKRFLNVPDLVLQIIELYQ